MTAALDSRVKRCLPLIRDRAMTRYQIADVIEVLEAAGCVVIHSGELRARDEAIIETVMQHAKAEWYADYWLTDGLNARTIDAIIATAEQEPTP